MGSIPTRSTIFQSMTMSNYNIQFLETQIALLKKFQSLEGWYRYDDRPRAIECVLKRTKTYSLTVLISYHIYEEEEIRVQLLESESEHPMASSVQTDSFTLSKEHPLYEPYRCLFLDNWHADKKQRTTFEDLLMK